MNIETLQVFVDVMRQGSFAAVARDRNVAPSSVSRTIAALEAQLGVRLFQRTTRQLFPTEAGRVYCDRVEPLVEELRQAAAIATDLSGRPQGVLRITASVSFGQTCVVPLLPQFQGQYPNLAVDLLLTDAVVDLLAERVDLAIRLGPLADSTLMAQHLMWTRYRVCASPDYLRRMGHPERPEEIAQHHCLRFPLPGFQSRWVFKDETEAVTPVAVRGRTVISNAIALKQCAVAGMGLALLADWLIRDELRSGTLVDVFPTYHVTATEFNTAAWLVYPSQAYVPRKVQVFLDFLKRAYPK